MFGLHSFRGGVYLPEYRQTVSRAAYIAAPSPARVVLPLVQHEGIAARPVVKAGDSVRAGDVVAEAGSAASARVHASISGVVSAVEPRQYPHGAEVTAVVIDAAPAIEPAPVLTTIHDWQNAEPQALIERARDCGLVDMCDGGRPLEQMLSAGEGAADTLIVDATECEPYLLANARLIADRATDIIEGACIAARALGIQRVHIAVTETMKEPISILRRALGPRRSAPCRLARIVARYPQHTDAQLVSAVSGRSIATGRSARDWGCVVLKAASVCALRDAVVGGHALVERVVTVAGPGVKAPVAVRVRLGVSARELLELCGVDWSKVRKVVMGGAMTGPTQVNADVPVTKSSVAVLALDTSAPSTSHDACIWCGLCHRACPMNLVPSMIARQVRAGALDEAREWGIDACHECGACSYICPSKVNLVHFVKLGKLNAAREHARGTSMEPHA